MMSLKEREMRAVNDLICYEAKQKAYFKNEIGKLWNERKSYERAYLKKCIATLRYFEREIKSNRVWFKEIKAG